MRIGTEQITIATHRIILIHLKARQQKRIHPMYGFRLNGSVAAVFTACSAIAVGFKTIDYHCDDEDDKNNDESILR